MHILLDGNVLHGRGVECEVGVLHGTIRGTMQLREILEGNGGYEHELRRALAIVFLPTRVLNEIFELLAVGIQCFRAPERFIESEKRNDDIGSQTGEPFVR